jgi:poly-gamma-glutamate capsule biosynthesis protein CapA/YwtB (metallophosphatase superfamily)
MSNDLVTLIAGGDTNIQRREQPEEALAALRPIIDDADCVVANLEMCLFRDDVQIIGKPGWIHSEARMVDGLTSAGIDVVSCANNVHYGGEAILSSLTTLDERGIAHTGAGRNLAAARQPAIVERGGVRIGTLAYTCLYFPHGHAATETGPGVHTLKCHTAYEPHPRVYEVPGVDARTRSWPDSEALAATTEDLRQLRDDVDVVVVYVHMGVPGSEEVAEYQRIVSRHLVEHGADLVLGCSAHVPQAVEVCEGSVIFYGLGNLVFDWPPLASHNKGLLVECQISGGAIADVSFRPLVQDGDRRQVRLAALDEPVGAAIANRVGELSQEFGTQFEFVDGRVEISMPESRISLDS